MSPTNLPVELTSFIGRERERAEVERLLATARLVTVAGPAGCGKTRLAGQVARKVSARFPDGVWLAALTSLQDPLLLAQLLTKAIGIGHDREQPALEALLDYVRSRRLLLLLDNCEHLIGDCARLAQRLLAEAPEVHLLATSREPLAVAGETVFALAGLAWPDVGAGEPAPEPNVLLQYDAPRLLVERVRARLPQFTLTPGNAVSAVEICRQLDGMPLALELASARANVLTLEQIAARLDDRFSLLISAQRAGPEPRHLSLRAAIDWSYELLPEPEKVLLRRLSVFTGGFTLIAAEVVCAGGVVEHAQVLEGLSALVNKSLLVAQTLTSHEARYQLLETIRQYAHEKLLAAGEAEALNNRLLAYCLEWAEATAQHLTGPDQQQLLDRLESEASHLRAALAWSRESGQIEAGLRIGIALYQFWVIRNYVAEGLAWFERLLPWATENIPVLVRANALTNASLLASLRGDTPAQVNYGRQAGHLAEAAGDEGKPALAWALAAMAHASRAVGDYEAEFQLAQRVIALRREAGDQYALGRELYIYSSTAMALGKYETAQAMLNEALPLLREAGSPYRLAMALNYRGDLARCQGQYARAQADYEESIALLREIGAERDLASVLHNLGHACLQRGEPERARALFNESLAIHQAQQHKLGQAECLLGFAALAIADGRPAAGARLLAATAALGGQRGAKFWAATRLAFEHNLTRARARLSDREFEAEQAAGSALSLAEALAFAQQVAGQAIATAKDPVEALTARERDVARLIARGKSNGEIAQELVVSKRTVETHIGNILAKLGYRNRAQIVRWALETGLVHPDE